MRVGGGLPSACGIACEVCRCFIEGSCLIKGCTSGVQAEGKLKLQREVLGFVCPVLECAFKRGVSFCLRDCLNFPCFIFYREEVPYSRRFLDILKKTLKR